MFDVGPAELFTLIVLAVIIFGPEKLPELARKAARILHFLRGIANNAQTQLSQELGTEVDLRDLNPRTFVQKHLLDEVQPVIDDVKKDLMDADASLRNEIADAKAGIAEQVPVATLPTPYDTEAT